jgi:hypothetical protein
MYIGRNDLPATVRHALTAIGFNRNEIAVTASESFSMGGGGGVGSRALIAVINLQTGEYNVTRGSWGGSNMFQKTPADDDRASRPLPEGFAVFLGSEGNGTYGSLRIHPKNLAPLLPATPEVTERERKILKACSYKSGYRREACERLGVVYAKDDPAIASLIARGFISANGTGMRLTTSGMNAKAPY